MNTTNNEEWETRLQDKINNLEFGLPEAFFHKPIKDFIRSERSSVRRETLEEIENKLITHADETIEAVVVVAIIAIVAVMIILGATK